VHFLRGLTDAPTSGAQYAGLAEAVVAALWPVVVAEFARKHGAPPGNGACVVGMGSLGAGRLTATSDLDLIVIYDAEGVEASEAFASFRDYQTTEAWTWEHLALTRARVVAGSDALAAQVAAFRHALLDSPRDPVAILGDVADMRAKLAASKPGDGVWDMKSGAGRVMDIELIGQAAALLSGARAHDIAAQLSSGVGIKLLSAADVADLCAAIGLFGRIQAAGRLLMAGVLDPDAIGEGGALMVLRETQHADMDALAQSVADAAARSDAIIAWALQVSA